MKSDSLKNHDINHIELLKQNLKGPSHYRPGTLCLHITNNCQLSCIYCNYWKNKEDIFLNPALKPLLHDIKPLNIVIVGGGEPVFNPGIFGDFLSALDCAYTGVITNGVEFPEEESVKKLKWVRVSLDACCSETYRKIKNIDMFDRVIENISRYKNSGIEYAGIGFTVTTQNMNDLLKLPDLLIRNSLIGENMFLQFKILRGRKKMLPSEQQLLQLIDTLKERIRSSRTTDFFEHKTNLYELKNFYHDRAVKQPTTGKCYYSLFYSLVRANGDVYPCGLMSYKNQNTLGNFNRDSYDSVVENIYDFFHSNSPKDNPECIGCWDNHINEFYSNALFEESNPYCFEDLLVPFPFSKFWGY